jgi:ADP-ribose pyrophosphatase YjhB (NUDIX family)
MDKKVTASGILVKFGNMVLLGRRSNACVDLHGYWSMPCGVIDQGETALQSATREFFEETNVKLSSEIKPLTIFQMKNGYYFQVFHTEIKSLIYPEENAKDALEHDEWGFFTIGKNTIPTPITKEVKKSILMLI